MQADNNIGIIDHESIIKKMSRKELISRLYEMSKNTKEYIETVENFRFSMQEFLEYEKAEE